MWTARLGSIYSFAARADFAAAIAAMLGVLVFDTLPGLFIGIAVSMLLLLYRVSRPHVARLARRGTRGSTWIATGLQPDQHSVVVRVEAGLFFANSDVVREQIERLCTPETRLVVLDAETSPFIDVTAAQMLTQLAAALRRTGSSCASPATSASSVTSSTPRFPATSATACSAPSTRRSAQERHETATRHSTDSHHDTTKRATLEQQSTRRVHVRDEVLMHLRDARASTDSLRCASRAAPGRRAVGLRQIDVLPHGFRRWANSTGCWITPSWMSQVNGHPGDGDRRRSSSWPGAGGGLLGWLAGDVRMTARGGDV